MSEESILRLQQTFLFQKLLEKEKSLGNHKISENIKSVVSEVAPLLERIPENMSEFTLHNENHSAKVVELMGKIIPSDTLEKLNIIELSILIYAAYLHDLGMTASKEEREEIIKNDPEFAKLLVFNEELSLKLEEAKKNGDHRTATFFEDKLFTEFLRKKHVERSNKLLKEKYGSEKTPISWKGIPYYKLVQSVCDSHGLPVRDLYDIKRWRRDSLVGAQSVNVQYLSVILRLADILDLDPERTPKCLLDFINPKDETSIKEWKKHLSIIGCKISHEEISIEAECEHPIYERALREFIDMIETERKESILLTSCYKDDLAKIYRLDLLKSITKEHIRSNGEYIYSDFHFKLDFHRVIDLLMGERLYGDPSLTLRELLQNSVDAVRYRKSMETKEGNQFSPFIKITLKADELIIEDNGVGMDEHIFEDYFLQIGRSYYNSSECRISGIEIDAVSEFGIGILSVFMVASKFTVESRRKPLDPLHPPDPINIEIPTAYDYFVRRPSCRSDIGTKITLSLKSDHPFSPKSLAEEIPKIAPFIEYPVVIETSETKERYIPFLPGDKLHTENADNEYFEIVFDEEKEGIEGKLKIFKPKNEYHNILHSNIFAQNGFAIPSQSLLPRRLLQNIQASINLSGQYKLSLSPSRSEIVKDEKYRKLIDKIQSEILKELAKYIKTLRDINPIENYVKVVNELMENNILSFDIGNPSSEGFVYQKEEFEENLKNIFFNHAPILTISDGGQRVYKTLKDLSESSIAITCINDWPERIPDSIILHETKLLIGAETVLLMHEEEGVYQRNNFLESILGHFSDIYITSIPGVVIKTFHNDKMKTNEDTSITFHNDDFTFLMHSDPIEKSPLFVHPPDFYWDEPDRVIYNARHPLIARLLKGEKSEDETYKAISKLTYRIERFLWHLWERLDSLIFKQNPKLGRSANLNYMLIGILKYYPEMFKEFHDAIELFWDEAKNLEIISPEENLIDISLDDLPWFWNCELYEFEYV
jgi:molecular chaperone HtpG